MKLYHPTINDLYEREADKLAKKTGLPITVRVDADLMVSIDSTVPDVFEASGMTVNDALKEVDKQILQQYGKDVVISAVDITRLQVGKSVWNCVF